MNRILLLSPAFFNDKDLAFKDTQIKAFAKNKALYMKAFYKNIGIQKGDEIYLREVDSLDSHTLEQCLCYEFKDADFELLKSRGVEIVAILGENDKIINAEATNAFFAQYGVVYLLKGANHLLREARR